MNRKIILAFAWTSLSFLSLNAQTYQLDNGWEFQRLDKVQKQAAIKNLNVLLFYSASSHATSVIAATYDPVSSVISVPTLSVSGQ